METQTRFRIRPELRDSRTPCRESNELSRPHDTTRRDASFAKKKKNRGTFNPYTSLQTRVGIVRGGSFNWTVWKSPVSSIIVPVLIKHSFFAIFRFGPGRLSE